MFCRVGGFPNLPPGAASTLAPHSAVYGSRQPPRAGVGGVRPLGTMWRRERAKGTTGSAGAALAPGASPAARPGGAGVGVCRCVCKRALPCV